MNGADANVRDTGYGATPAGWAEHHGQREAHELLAAVERPDRRAASGDDAPTADAISGKGAALRTVTAAFTAMSEARFDDLGALLASDIDWRGVADDEGQIPRCNGRDQALERMRIGLLANARVAVSALVEEGVRVIAHVHSVGGGEVEPPERFVVAEVHDGQITHLSGYATEREALDALRADTDLASSSVRALACSSLAGESLNTSTASPSCASPRLPPSANPAIRSAAPSARGALQSRASSSSSVASCAPRRVPRAVGVRVPRRAPRDQRWIAAADRVEASAGIEQLGGACGRIAAQDPQAGAGVAEIQHPGAPPARAELARSRP